MGIPLSHRAGIRARDSALSGDARTCPTSTIPTLSAKTRRQSRRQRRCRHHCRHQTGRLRPAFLERGRRLRHRRSGSESAPGARPHAHVEPHRSYARKVRSEPVFESGRVRRAACPGPRYFPAVSLARLSLADHIRARFLRLETGEQTPGRCLQKTTKAYKSLHLPMSARTFDIGATRETSRAVVGGYPCESCWRRYDFPAGPINRRSASHRQISASARAERHLTLSSRLRLARTLRR